MHQVASSSPRAVPAPAHKVRFVTAASLFDGHDASINIMRRILQASGAEVIHLGHNRSVKEIVDAAVEEDVQGIAVSSYQGGHVEYFKYMVDMLRERGRGDIRVFGGGGGVIIADEIRELEDHGVEKIYSPEDGQQLGLQGMIDDMLERCDFDPGSEADLSVQAARTDTAALARIITAIENGTAPASFVEQMRKDAEKLRNEVPVLGITGTGGSGKSSLTDELVLRLRLDYDENIKIAIIAVDPSRRKTGGALLGDRIRMNAINTVSVYMRSIATRGATGEVPECLTDIIAITRLSGFDVVIVETPGIGQGDAGIVPFVDTSLYVMTPEFGAASQLEKIDMLDFSNVIAINKFDRRGAQDALRDVRKQVQRNREAFGQSPDEMPVYGTMAAQFSDDGVTALYQGVRAELESHGLKSSPGQLPTVSVKESTSEGTMVPAARVRYLSEVSDSVRGFQEFARDMAVVARERQQLREARRMLGDGASDNGSALEELIESRERALDSRCHDLLDAWPAIRDAYSKDAHVATVRDREIKTELTTTTLSGTVMRKISLPKYHDEGDLLQWMMTENLPGYFPYTAGVFPFKRENEDPTRMFAGEGDAFRTNKRFKYLSQHSDAKRLSTAFDSVTLYGSDPDERPDIYGKVGNSGVSIAILDDMKALYDGFDLCDPSTSVSMTINGPAPTILAMFLNTAIDQKIVEFQEAEGRAPDDTETATIRATALTNVRGTVQADILKEDQGQNTCIFSTEFSLKVMGDIQQYFIDNSVRNFYSVSISGYHIAEAGANPITQLALTLSNAFTYVEAYLARGMDIDEFAPNLSFFFSNGMDPEYTVLGRVARRIWAIAMREKYGANERSQRLKYHIQTSGRSLHSMEIDFNDIRTTLQALIAVYDNCNSLHTNAHDEAITTPTEDSVRRALAIQLIINREWGLAKSENSNQGSFVIEELTDLVEAAVLAEFDRISERGGVLGAMETGYQRGRIQDESMYYEHQKHDGSLPIIGVNTFMNPNPAEDTAQGLELARSTEDEKRSQISRLREFHKSHEDRAPEALRRLQRAAIAGDNVFVELMDAVRCCSLGQITTALFEVGGKYRRSM